MISVPRTTRRLRFAQRHQAQSWWWRCARSGRRNPSVMVKTAHTHGDCLFNIAHFQTRPLRVANRPTPDTLREIGAICSEPLPMGTLCYASRDARRPAVSVEWWPLFSPNCDRFLQQAANRGDPCDHSTVCASSHFLFRKRLRKDEAICRRSFRSDDPRGSDRAYCSIWRRN
jgi:hypothetical protein